MKLASLLPLILVLGADLEGSDWRIPAPGRVRDLSRLQPEELVPPAPISGSRHFLVKLVSALDSRVVAELRRSGLVLQTPLSSDSGIVLAGSGASPGDDAMVVWYAPLEPEDKAPAELLATAANHAAVAVLGHPGTTRAQLLAAAGAAGLAVSGGHDSPSGARLDILPGSSGSALRIFLQGDGVLAALPAAPPRLSNDRAVGTIQSGAPGGATVIFDQGIYGAGEVIGILDTGLDVDSCFFADPVHPAFTVNTYSSGAGYGTAVGAGHRKIAAYDFLHSCDQFPTPCDRPDDPFAYDDQGHGTHAAGNAAGDNFLHLLIHDHGDGMAPGTLLVVQDAGYSANPGPCGDLPGLGCAPDGVTAIFEQAYRQGARIHSDSWADDSQGPPPANAGYSMTARDVDDFVFQHPDFLPFFVAGNDGALGPESIPSPGNGKNVVCVGSTRNTPMDSEENLSDFSGIGPAADGRLKPDVVAPGVNISAYSDHSILTDNCDVGEGAGTSFATPIAAGAAALVRSYFDQGFYPTGAAEPSNAFGPSAALLKAALVASAESLSGTRLGAPVAAAPSPEQGFGRINLSTVLSFSGSPFQLFAVDRAAAFATSDSTPIVYPLTVTSSGQPLRVVLVWMDLPGVPRAYSDPTPELVDDLDLAVQDPAGAVHAGNATLTNSLPGAPAFDRLNNVETVTIADPVPGPYAISVIPHSVLGGTPVGFAIVATGGLSFDRTSGLQIEAASAAITADPDGDGLVQSCELITAAFTVVNSGAAPSPPISVLIAPLDRVATVATPLPISLAAIPPGGSARVSFRFQAGSSGEAPACGQSIPFRATLSADGEAPVSAEFSFAAPLSPPGCGSPPPLDCAATMVQPVHPPPPRIGGSRGGS